MSVTTLRTLPIDALTLAGLRLDAAAAEIARLNQRGATEDDEAEYGTAEEALDRARAEYRRIVAERTGESADSIERRIQL